MIPSRDDFSMSSIAINRGLNSLIHCLLKTLLASTGLQVSNFIMEM